MPFLVAAIPAAAAAASAAGGITTAAGLGAAATSIGTAAIAPSAIVGTLGTATTLLGGFAQGQYAKSAANANAAALNRQANETEGAAKVKAYDQALGASREISAGRAAYGAAGVETAGGSPLATLNENIRQAQADSMYTRMTGNLKAQNLREEAGIEQQQGRNAMMSSLFQAGSGLLSGIGGKTLLGAIS